MPDPLLSSAALGTLATLYEMGDTWESLSSGDREKLYRAVEAQWRPLRWIDSVNPFLATDLETDLRAALAEHLQYAAEQRGSTNQDPFPLATHTIVAARLRKPLVPQSIGGATAQSGSAATAAGVDTEAVDAAISRHRADSDAHHTPPPTLTDYDAGDSLTTNDKQNFSPSNIAEIADRIVEDNVEVWARDTTTPIPTPKLVNAASGGTSTSGSVERVYTGNVGLDTSPGWVDTGYDLDTSAALIAVSLGDRSSDNRGPLVGVMASDLLALTALSNPPTGRGTSATRITMATRGPVDGNNPIYLGRVGTRLWLWHNEASNGSLYFYVYEIAVGAGPAGPQGPQGPPGPKGDPGGGQGAGLTEAQQEILQSAAELEVALRKETTLVNAYAETVAVSKAAYRIANQSLPSAEADREMVVTIGGAGIATTRFDLTTLAALPLVTNAQQLSSTNAIVFKDANDDSYYIAHASGGQLYFGADNLGAYTVTLVDSRINTTRWVDTSRLLPDTSGLTASDDGDVFLYEHPTGFQRGGIDGEKQVSVRYDSAGNALKIGWDPSEKQQSVFDAFRTGGWSDVTSAITNATRSTAWTRTQLNTASFVNSYTNPAGTAISPAFFGVRIPIADRGKRYRIAYGNFTEGGADVQYELIDNSADYVYETAQYVYLTQNTRPQLDGSDSAKVQVFEPFEINPDDVHLPVPREALTELWNRHSQGISVASVATAQRSSAYSSTYTVGTKHGIVFYEVEWHIVGAVNLVSFSGRRSSGTVTLSEIRAAAAYAASGDAQGVKIATAPLVASSGTYQNQTVGEVDLYLVKDGNDNVAFYLDRTRAEGASGTQTATSVQAVISVRVLENDAPAPAAGGGGGGGFTKLGDFRYARGRTNAPAQDTGLTIPSDASVLMYVRHGNYLTGEAIFVNLAALRSSVYGRTTRGTDLQSARPAVAINPNSDARYYFALTATNGLLMGTWDGAAANISFWTI